MMTVLMRSVQACKHSGDDSACATTPSYSDACTYRSLRWDMRVASVLGIKSHISHTGKPPLASSSHTTPRNWIRFGWCSCRGGVN